VEGCDILVKGRRSERTAGERTEMEGDTKVYLN